MAELQRTRSRDFEPIPDWASYCPVTQEHLYLFRQTDRRQGRHVRPAIDKALTGLIGRIHKQGGVVAAICHGSSALANVWRPGGDYLVTGRAVVRKFRSGKAGAAGDRGPRDRRKAAGRRVTCGPGVSARVHKSAQTHDVVACPEFLDAVSIGSGIPGPAAA
jgi:hypothetical protein